MSRTRSVRRHILAALAASTACVGAASVEANDNGERRSGGFVNVDDDDIPTPETVVDPGLPDTIIERVTARCLSTGSTEVAFRVTNRQNGGPARKLTAYVETLADRGTYQAVVEDGASMGRAFDLGNIPAGEYKLVVAQPTDPDGFPIYFAKFFNVGRCPPASPGPETGATVPPDTETSEPTGTEVTTPADTETTSPGPATSAGPASEPTGPAGESGNGADAADEAGSAVNGSLADESGAPSAANVFMFADPDTPVGESKLRHTDDGVIAMFWIGSLQPSHAVTLRWVVFNRPENCSPPACDDDDIFIEGDPALGRDDEAIDAAGITSGFAAGSIVGADGTLLLIARLERDRPGVDVTIGADDEPLLREPGAEIHLIARSHGPIVAGFEDIQTTSFTGGCSDTLMPPLIPSESGQCGDVAFAVHRR